MFDLGRTIPLDNWTPQTLDDFKRMVDLGNTFDKAANQPDCEDPAKAEWMKQVEDRLARLEAAQSSPHIVGYNIDEQDSEYVEACARFSDGSVKCVAVFFGQDAVHRATRYVEDETLRLEDTLAFA